MASCWHHRPWLVSLMRINVLCCKISCKELLSITNAYVLFFKKSINFNFVIVFTNKKISNNSPDAAKIKDFSGNTLVISVNTIEHNFRLFLINLVKRSIVCVTRSTLAQWHWTKWARQCHPWQQLRVAAVQYVLFFRIVSIRMLIILFQASPTTTPAPNPTTTSPPISNEPPCAAWAGATGNLVDRVWIMLSTTEKQCLNRFVCTEFTHCWWQSDDQRWLFSVVWKL